MKPEEVEEILDFGLWIVDCGLWGGERLLRIALLEDGKRFWIGWRGVLALLCYQAVLLL